MEGSLSQTHPSRSTSYCATGCLPNCWSDYYIDGRTPGNARLRLPPPIACALCVPALFSMDGEAQSVSTIFIGNAMVAVSLAQQRLYLGRFELVQVNCYAKADASIFNHGGSNNREPKIVSRRCLLRRFNFCDNAPHLSCVIASFCGPMISATVDFR